MWLRLYAVLMLMLTPLGLLYFYWRSRKDRGYRQHIGERFGWLKPATEWQDGLLIHSVSVGETLAARTLITLTLARYPNLPITVTCMTPTARRLIESSFGDRVRCLYFPWDATGSVERWLNSVRPRAVWILETELWPNFMRAAERMTIPVVLLNARLSKRSAAGYRKVSHLTAACWQQLAWVSAQTHDAARRFKALGVVSSRLAVDGNLKFDVSVEAKQRQVAEALRQPLQGRPVWLAASTHPGEHEQVLAAHRELCKQWPNSLLIIAPRHPEQFETVARLIAASGFTYQRRSMELTVDANCQVLLADTMGEMMVWGCLASATFVGGSLIPRGGHNPLELIAAGSAVLSGPSVFNFQQVYQQLDRVQGVRWVDSCATLSDQVMRLIQDPAYRSAQIDAADKVWKQHQGATQRMLEHASEATLTGSFMIKTQATSKEFIKFDQSILAECESKYFSPKYWQQRKAIAGNSTGRSTVWFIQQGDHGMLLRHYYRGGLVGKVNKDRFLREPVEQTRAIHEFDLLHKLHEMDLPVPRPIAARMVKTGLFSYRADILVEVIAGAVDVFRLLREKPLTAEQWQTLGAVVRQLHNQNVYHSDLNCHNLMLDDNDKAWIVDFDKCGFKEPDQWKQDNLARLKRSLLKEKGKHESFFWKESRDWPEFLTGYEKA